MLLKYDTWYVNVEPMSFPSSARGISSVDVFEVVPLLTLLTLYHFARTEDLLFSRKQRTVDGIIAAAAEIRFLEERIALPR